MKYEILHDHAMVVDGGRITCYRIRALRDIPQRGVKAGDLGGYVEGEHNLDQNDDSWVYGNARVYGKARVYGNARVYDDSWVSGKARVYDDARLKEAQFNL